MKSEESRLGFYRVLGLWSFWIALVLLTDASWWRVGIAGWLLFLGVQSAVALASRKR